MAIDSSKIQRYFMFVHVGSSLITESDLTTLYCTFGDSTQPALDSMVWKNTPQKNRGNDPDLNVFHVDYNMYSGDDVGGVQYYSHDPGAEYLIHDQSWVWVKFQRGSKTYIGGELIGDYEIHTPYPEDNTQYIGTNIYIEDQGPDPGPDPEPDPPTPTGRKYRIYVKREDKHAFIDNENILVGNTRGDGKSKETSGVTLGAEYSYVEFNSWEELVAAVEGGSGPTPSETLSLGLSKDDIDATGESIYLIISSNTGWTVTESNPWIIPTRREGGGNDSIQVSVLENHTSDVRYGSITVTTTGGLAKSVIIQQRKRANVTYILVLGFDDMSLGVGEGKVITATYCRYEDDVEISSVDVTYEPGVEWRSGDTSIVTVSHGGNVTGISPGFTEIWATYNGKTSQYTRVTVQ